VNLPDSEFLAAPLWLVTLLHLLTFTMHLAAMNFLLGGVMVTLVAAVGRRWDSKTLQMVMRTFPPAMAATVTLGVAPLLFLQLVYPRQVYAAAIVSGWFWLGVIGAVILAYYALYYGVFKGESTGRARPLVLIITLLGMLYVSAVYSSVFALAERPAAIHDLYAGAQEGTVWNPSLKDYGMRWLHMITGGVTIGGFCMAVVGRERKEVFTLAEGFFIGGMALAFVTGLGYLAMLGDELVLFMRSPGIWAIMLGVLLSLGSLHFFFKKRLLAAGIMLFISLFAMVYARHALRLVRLAGDFDPASWRVATQWSPLILFVVCFVIMLVVVGYMLKLALPARRA
jgi:hypothetical protein